MKWKYFIPHQWSGDRAAWEDVHLLPDDPGYDGEALWLTFTALGCASDDEERAERIAKLEGRPFVCDGTEMYLAAEDFSREELIGCVGTWLRESGIAVDGFEESPYEDFAGRNDHLKQLAELRERFGPEDAE